MKNIHEDPNLQQRIYDIDIERAALSHEAEMDRARSIYVGKNSGAVEICMRGDGRKFLWTILHAEEAIELIHSLAGIVGCHIAIRPRDDFASHFRSWTLTEREKKLWDLLENSQNKQLNIQEEQNEPKKIVATKKNINKRSSK